MTLYQSYDLKPIGEFGSGIVYQEGNKSDLKDGLDKVYIPKEINDNTEVIVASKYYLTGKDLTINNGINIESKNGIILDYLESNNPNLIIINPTAETQKDLPFEDLMKICEIVSNKTNKEILPTVYSGFSLGDKAAIHYTTEALKCGKKMPPLTLALFDPKVRGAGTSSPAHDSGGHELTLISNEDYANMRENGTTIMGFERLREIGKEEMLNNYATAGRNGVKTMIFYQGIEHDSAEMSNISTYLYGFLSDKDAKKFLSNFEGAVIYDFELGGWRDLVESDLVEASRLNTMHMLSSLNDIENCDNTFIKEHVNNIRSKIRNVSFLRETTSVNLQSTCLIPSQEASILQTYFDTILNLLIKLEKDTQSLIQIGNNYADLDKYLSDLANDLNSPSLNTEVQNNDNSNL